ncbi:MAG: hypothetical protein E7292_01005 [Lachnospiraceae bacterium]|nr:hypothetical protein [Lachnospiraceae bacterium]
MKKKLTTKMMRYPVLITSMSAFVMLLMFFMPYASAKGERREYLIKYADSMYMKEIGMTYADAVHISLFEYVRMYAEAINQDMHKVISIVCLVLIGIFAGFTLLTLLMALLKKPIGIIIFDLLALGAFRIVCFDFQDRGVVPNSSYSCGIAGYMVYATGVVVLAGAIWLFVEKRKAKKLAKMEQKSVIQEQMVSDENSN